MLDSAILPLQRRVLDAPARWLVRAGIGADAVTVAGFAVGIGAFAALAFQSYGLALLAVAVNRLADGLDGAVARATRPTDRGAFADIAFDFAFYALVPLGFALADPQANALAAALLIAAFVGTGSSFLAFAVIAAQRGMQSERYRGKGIYYLDGLAEGTETIAVFVLMCLFPQWFAVLAYAFAALCAVTAMSRWWHGWNALSGD